jgi:hypothetical protein
MEERVVRDGAWWLGRKFIDDAVFRHEYGVYPRTMAWICTTLACDVMWTLKSLWWLKNYPTDEGIANQGASPSYFRAHLWPQLQLLKEKLPEVSAKTFLLWLTLQLPFHLRYLFNGTHKSFADMCACIDDTTTIKTYKPKLAHGDFDRYGFHFWNQHKKTFGVKLEVPVATQRTPVPLGVTVVPAGWHDLSIARLLGGLFSRLQPGERALGDPGYVGESSKIYAPPRKNMDSFVDTVDKVELTLQRRVELANAHLKQFQVSRDTVSKRGGACIP